MTAAWPSTVPQVATISGFGEKPERNVAEFSPEVGPPMTRRRSGVSTDALQFETTMTFDEWDDLHDFYRDDVKDGTLSFTRKHPRDLGGSDLTFRFISEPSFRAAGPDFGSASISIRKMP